MVDPLTQILVGVGIHVGKTIWDRLWDGRQGAVYVSSTGEAVVGRTHNELLDLRFVPTHLVGVDFVAGDEWSAEWVTTDNPCLLVVAGHDFVELYPCTIDDRYRLELPDGYYQIGLQVYDEHLVDPDLMQLVAWQEVEIPVYGDSHVELPIRIDPDFDALRNAWNEVFTSVTNDLDELEIGNELSVFVGGTALDMRFTIPDPARPTRVRATAVLRDYDLSSRALEAARILDLLGWGVKQTSKGWLSLRTHRATT
jgi:hypothetical protein